MAGIYSMTHAAHAVPVYLGLARNRETCTVNVAVDDGDDGLMSFLRIDAT